MACVGRCYRRCSTSVCDTVKSVELGIQHVVHVAREQAEKNHLLLVLLLLMLLMLMMKKMIIGMLVTHLAVCAHLLNGTMSWLIRMVVVCVVLLFVSFCVLQALRRSYIHRDFPVTTPQANQNIGKR